MINKIRKTAPLTYVICDLKGEEIVGKFTKMICKKRIKKNLALKKLSKEKVINYMLNKNVMIDQKDIV